MCAEHARLGSGTRLARGSRNGGGGGIDAQRLNARASARQVLVPQHTVYSEANDASRSARLVSGQRAAALQGRRLALGRLSAYTRGYRIAAAGASNASCVCSMRDAQNAAGLRTRDDAQCGRARHASARPAKRRTLISARQHKPGGSGVRRRCAEQQARIAAVSRRGEAERPVLSKGAATAPAGGGRRGTLRRRHAARGRRVRVSTRSARLPAARLRGCAESDPAVRT